MPPTSLPAPFDRLLSIGTMNSDPGSVCVLDAEGLIVFVNEAWDAFAAENGGSPAVFSDQIIGRRWLDFIHGDLVREVYGGLINEARGGDGQPARPVQCRGQCNSPTLGREVVTTFTGIIDRSARLIVGVHALSQVIETWDIATRYAPAAPDESRFRGADGIVLQCCNCRRVRAAKDDEVWEFVPAWVERPAQGMSHGYCRTCLELYFGPVIARRVRERKACDA